jgi:GT2 family glycosyltransferase
MVYCVVLNWNRWQDTLACLHTLASQTVQDLQVLIVDNGSTDGSQEKIGAFTQAQSGPVGFRLIETGENLGFGKGSNVGIREALRCGAEFVWLLNNDTECPPDSLEKLFRVARQQPEAGIIGTVLLYHHDPSQVQAWGGGQVFRWFGTASHFVTKTPLKRDTYITFASALIRSEVFESIGLLYEGAFMYYEDSDFCLRLQETKWHLAIAEDTAILHKESASTDGVRNPFMEKTIAVSGMHFLKRHAPLPLLSMFAFLAIKLVNRARRGEWAALRAVLQGWSEYRRHPVPRRRV